MQPLCHVTRNSSGTPAVNREVITDLTAATTVKAGLRVRCDVDDSERATGVKGADGQMEALVGSIASPRRPGCERDTAALMR